MWVRVSGVRIEDAMNFSGPDKKKFKLALATQLFQIIFLEHFLYTCRFQIIFLEHRDKKEFKLALEIPCQVNTLSCTVYKKQYTLFT